MTKERFIQIFIEEENDEEWAEVIWNRVPQNDRDTLSEERVRGAAKGWTEYAKDGGF